jgi:hypothetical protein
VNEHTTARRRRTRPGGQRMVLAVAAAAVGIIALSSGVTSAFWTDTSAATTGIISSGTMDLQLQTTNPTGAQGIGTTYDADDITVSAITPAESRAFPVTVKNVGSANFTYTATATRSTARAWGFADGSITLQLFTGTPDTSDVTYPIQQTCSGTALTTAQPVGNGNTTVIPTQSLAAGGSRTLCAVVTMSTAAPNTDQGKSGALRLDVTAAQVTS